MEKQEIQKEREILDADLKSPWYKSGIMGFLLGLAMIIPGVSGAQIAILFKLYEKLTYSVSNLFKNFKICFLFLLPIGIGLVIGFGAGFFAVKELLEIAAFIVICFFAGMMLGGMPIITKEIKGSKIKISRVLLMILGLSIPISISVVSVLLDFNLGQAFNNMDWWIFVVSIPLGIVVSLTQVIPGLSATATLMSLGFYKPILDGVSLVFSQPLLIIFYLELVIGFLIGMFVFSKLVTYLLNKFRTSFFYMIVGLSISSIFAMFYNPEVVDVYSSRISSSTSSIVVDLSVGIPLFVIGFVLIFLVFYFSDKKEKNNSEIISNN